MKESTKYVIRVIATFAVLVVLAGMAGHFLGGFGIIVGGALGIFAGLRVLPWIDRLYDEAKYREAK